MGGLLRVLRRKSIAPELSRSGESVVSVLPSAYCLLLFALCPLLLALCPHSVKMFGMKRMLRIVNSYRDVSEPPPDAAQRSNHSADIIVELAADERGLVRIRKYGISHR